MEEDNTITIQDAADRLDIPHTMVQRILQDELAKKWYHTKWIPHHLSIANKGLRVERCQDILEAVTHRLCRANLVTIDEKWFYLRHLKPMNKIGYWMTPGGDGPVLQTPKRSTMEKKFMAIVAVSQRGQHFFELLNQNESINSERYIEFLAHMETFFGNIANPLRFENMRLIQDNARPHVSRASLAYMQGKNIRLLKQPAYSPDCNLCDRYIFARLEAKRSGHLNNKDDVVHFLNQELPLFTADRMEIALQKMETDMQNIIEGEGCYL